MGDAVGMIEPVHQRRSNEWMHGAADMFTDYTSPEIQRAPKSGLG
ncbi:hypothetical protein [Mesorhizobium sp. M0854]